MMETSPGATSQRLPAWIWILSLLALGLLLRLSDWSIVWQSETGLLFKSPDGYYHLRRMMLALMAPDQLGVLDHWRGLDQTEPCIWPLQYSWIMASWVWILSLGQISQVRSEWLVAFFPVCVGLLTAGVVYLLARRMAPSWAWLALLLYLVLPKNIDISQFTSIDHHISETLAFSLALLCLTQLEQSRERRWRIASAAALCLLYIVWSGSTLYMAVLLGLLAVWALFKRSEALADLALAFETAALALVCCYPWQGSWQLLLRYDRPSLFQPLVVLACGLCLHALAWRKDYPKRAVGAAVAMLGAGAFLAWPVLMGLDFLWGQGGGYPFVSQVAELQPLRLNDLPMVIEAISPLVLVMPLLAIWLGREAWRSGRLLNYLVSLSLLIFLVLSLRNQRFLYMVSLLLPLLLADFLDLSSGSLRPRIKSLLLAGVAFSGVWALGSYLSQLRASGPIVHPSYVALADWLREQTPSAGNWLAARQMPTYAVLDNWDKGHFLLNRARRPVVSDNFGLQAGLSHELLSLASEPEGLELMRKSSARYLVVGSELLWGPPILLGPASRKPQAPWLAPKSFEHLGQAYDLGYLGPGFQASLYYRLMFPEALNTVPQQLRLVYESADTVPVHLFNNSSDPFLLYGQTPPPGQQAQLSNPARFRIYERVTGALLEGRAPTQEAGTISVEVISNTGRRFTLRWPVQPDRQGRFSLRLPYAESANPKQARAAGPYQLELPGLVRKIQVNEQQVLQGEKV